jgi:hypothetical protein
MVHAFVFPIFCSNSFSVVAITEQAKQVAAKEAESKKRAEAQKGKQAATEDPQS